jgi:hypothetical protein
MKSRPCDIKKEVDEGRKDKTCIAEMLDLKSNRRNGVRNSITSQKEQEDMDLENINRNNKNKEGNYELIKLI